MRQVVEDKMVHLSEKFIRPGTKDFEIGGGEKKNLKSEFALLKISCLIIIIYPTYS